MLVGLGLMNLSGIRPWMGQSGPQDEPVHSTVHTHAHQHGDYVHTHMHGHDPETHPHPPDQTPLARLDRWFGSLGAYQLLRPLIVGIVHGLAGSAAVALLVLTTIRDPRWSILYLLVFGLGTIVGMMLITATIAWPLTRANALRGGLPGASGGFGGDQSCVRGGDRVPDWGGGRAIRRVAQLDAAVGAWGRRGVDGTRSLLPLRSQP